MTRKVVSIADPLRMGYTGSLRASNSASADTWFTPAMWVDRFRTILGGKINLDPFSSTLANNTVKAERIFTASNSAFDHCWNAVSLFMNPPYSRGLCAKAIAHLLSEYASGRVANAIVLVNNMTDTEWFHDLASSSERRCDIRGRISFVAVDGKRISGNTRGQSIFLLCKDSVVKKRFDKILGKYGLIYWISR